MYVFFRNVKNSLFNIDNCFYFKQIVLVLGSPVLKSPKTPIEHHSSHKWNVTIEENGSLLKSAETTVRKQLFVNYSGR